MLNRLVLVSVLSLLFVLPVLAQEGTTPVQSVPPANTVQPTPIIKPFDFRKIYWGMTRDEVKASEYTAPFSEEPETLNYHVLFAGQKVGLNYTFGWNKLYVAGYVFSETYSDINGGYENYKKVKDYLETVYGKTDVSDKPQEGVDPNVKYQAHWRTTNTDIFESLILIEHKYTLEIIYHSITLGETPQQPIKE